MRNLSDKLTRHVELTVKHSVIATVTFVRRSWLQSLNNERQGCVVRQRG
jgi:hypothetical protein